MTINVDLLRQTLEYITAHPEEWDQEQWAIKDSCGTAYCAAGTTVVLHDGKDAINWDSAHRRNYGSRLSTDEAIRPDGEWIGIRDRAQELLGLNHFQADRLFDASNTLYDLWAIAESMTDGVIEIPQKIEELKFPGV